MERREVAEAKGRDLTSALPHRTVLCAHAKAETQQFLQSVLPECRFVFACTGFEALRCANHAIFDLYIVDYWLPDWTGVGLCRDIRKIDARGPLCFYATRDQHRYRERALAAGANLYLEAPVDAEHLSHHLRGLIERAHIDSLAARFEEERVIHEELKARAAAAGALAKDAMTQAIRAIERSGKIKAYQAFVAAGGTRANFERWWPHQFGSAWAAVSAAASAETHAGTPSSSESSLGGLGLQKR